MAKISVIIPIYNGASHLRRCLDSLKAQTFEDIEIILVDDGSVDDTKNICMEYVKSDLRFEYYYQENAGASAARNNGLRYATAEYIAFCDCDDSVEKDMYETLLDLLKQNNADVSAVSFFDDFGTEAEEPEIKIMDGKQAWSAMLSVYGFSGFVWNKLFKRELLSGIRFDENLKLYEDMVFCGEVFEHATKAVYSNVQKYHYVSGFGHGKVRGGYETALASCEALRKQSLKYYEEMPAELKALYVTTIVSVANKKAVEGNLSKDDYIRMKDTVEKYIGDCMSNISEGTKKKYKVLCLGYQPFKLICRLYARK